MSDTIEIKIDGKLETFTSKQSGFYTAGNAACHRFPLELSERIRKGEKLKFRTNGHKYEII